MRHVCNKSKDASVTIENKGDGWYISGDDWYVDDAISFCPFCGKRIESLEIIRNDEAQVVSIEGVPYSYEFFRKLSIRGYPEGTYFKVIVRDDDTGVITLKRFEPSILKA